MNTGHSEGFNTYVKGYASHTEGYYTTASGSYSHAEGKNTIATHQSQHVFGEYNTLDASTATTGRGNYIEIVGNGVNASTTSNARTLDWDGNETISGILTDINGKQSNRHYGGLSKDEWETLSAEERMKLISK